MSQALPCAAQVTPAAGYVPPDDTPSITVGATLFADYTIVTTPKITDADGNRVTANAFNIGRAYLNVTGHVSHRISFRITPDIVRESGAGSSLTGSYTFRLKYAYAQFNLDDWTNAGRTGTWVRLGMQQTPYVDFMESVYRYRFQGTIFEEREGFMSSSDVGAAAHYSLPGNYGDLHGGVYNGESYARAETNNQKAVMLRGTVRPLRMHPVLRGLRVTGFYDRDAYLRHAPRTRAIGALTFEHPRVNAAWEYLVARDQTSAAAGRVEGRGYSLWATPRAARGWEGLIRFDRLVPSRDLDAARDRTIGGIAYWFPHQGTVSTALLLDVERQRFHHLTAAPPDDHRVALHALVNF
ncbi:MAG: hypothetical protein ABI603_00970 [Acidobacteriota bacterium]